MAWTTPRTWAASELVTATLLNTHLRDNLNALKNPPADYAIDIEDTFASSSTWFVNVTNAEVEITTTGGRLLIGAFGVVAAASTTTTSLAYAIDDVLAGHGTHGLQRVYIVGGGRTPFGWAYLTTAASAANHTVKLRMKTDGTPTTLAQWMIWVREV